MKGMTLAMLTAGTLSMSGCAAALALADVAALYAILDSGRYEYLGTMEAPTCAIAAQSFNEAAWARGEQVHHVCVHRPHASPAQ